MNNQPLPANTHFQASFNIWLVQNNFSDHTLTTYSRGVGNYLQFCNSIGCGEKAHTKELLDRYIFHLQSTNAKPSTINQTLAALAKYFSYHGVDFPDIARLQADRKQKTRLLDNDEIQGVLSITFRKSEKVQALILMCFEGLTAGQCSELNIGDIETQANGSIKVYLNRKGRTLHLSDHVTKVLQAWMKTRCTLSATSPNLPVFTNNGGGRISRIGVDYLIKSVGQQIGLVLSARTLALSGKRFIKSRWSGDSKSVN
jgi:site-specific recombinase XerD